MTGFYLKAYQLLPRFLRQRIHPLEEEIERFVGASVPEGNGLVLDAGAGEGRFRPHFSRQRYLALDSTVGDREWNYSGTDICASLLGIPLKSECVDLVLNIQVLEHVSDPARALKEMSRVLKPGGRIYLTAPQGWHEHQQPNDFYRFTRYSLEGLLTKAGLQPLEIAPMGGYFRYLGHRLTYIPKVLFQVRRGVRRWVLFPLELLSLVLFCFLGPLACYYLDRLDRQKEFTLGYRCRAAKPDVKDDSSPDEPQRAQVETLSFS